MDKVGWLRLEIEIIRTGEAYELALALTTKQVSFWRRFRKLVSR